MKKPLQPARCPTQRGMSLVVVLVIVLLVSLLLLGSTRTTWLNERIVSSEADTQRAFAAAEALVRDAELDILGMRADGTACPANPVPMGCRSRSNGTGFLPRQDDDLDRLATITSAGFRGCFKGLCLPENSGGLADAWRTPADMRLMQAVGATYGQFTGADTTNAGNPLLSKAHPRGWYWIEVLRYSTANLIHSGIGTLPLPKPEQPYVFRIHAVVQGMRPGTQVYLRSVFVPDPMN